QEIDKVNKALDALEDRTSRRDLTFNTKKTKEALRDAQASIIQVGVLTPAQKRKQSEFLEDFTVKVKDAQDAVKKFDLTKQRDELEKTRAAAEKTANEGIQRLIDKFEAGQISAGEFNRILRNQLGPAFDVLKTKAGQNLGLVFTRDFKREVAALIEQAKALSAFFPLG